MTVTLYSQPGCGPCSFVKKAMESIGLDFIVRDIREDPDAEKRVRELGYPGTPVTEVKTASGSYDWHGVNLEKIRRAYDNQTR